MICRPEIRWLLVGRCEKRAAMQVEYAEYVHGIVPQVKLLLNAFREAKGKSGSPGGGGGAACLVGSQISRQGSPSSGAHGGAGVRMTGSSILWIVSMVLLGTSASIRNRSSAGSDTFDTIPSFIRIPSEVEHELQRFVQPQAEWRRRLAQTSPIVQGGKSQLRHESERQSSLVLCSVCCEG